MTPKTSNLTRKNGLSIKRQIFVREFVKTGNATQSAIAAGYSHKTAGQQGNFLLKNVKISEAISRKLQEKEAKSDLSIELLDRELSKLVRADPRSLFHADGTLKGIHELDDDIAAAVASIETLQTRRRNVRGKRTTVHVSKVRLWDKIGALTLAARRLGALQDQVAVKGNITLELLVNQAVSIRDARGKGESPMIDVTPESAAAEGISNEDSGK